MTNPPPWPPPSHLFFLLHFQLLLSYILLTCPMLSHFLPPSIPHCIRQCGIKLSLHSPSPCVCFFDSRLSKKIVLGPTFDRYSTSQDLTYIRMIT
ncbi:hypothetical protein BDE02_01G087000 [Populus trichocarpa]|nr:hypothetical protein BDE02_01G087000 [Populus trichocarpa]